MVGMNKWGWATRTALLLAAENAVAKSAPRIYSAAQRLFKTHGRSDGQNGEAGAHYFRAVADDYQAIAEVAGVTSPGQSVYEGRTVLELGPGDTKAVALLAKLRGAASWDGCDAFDIQSRDQAYLDGIYGPILRDERATLPLSEVRAMLEKCRMHTSLTSMAGKSTRPNLVLSRAVLEHVNDVDGLFGELVKVCAADAVFIHKVDLRSHGIEKDNPLDFLMFPNDLYARVTSHLGRPNRLRADAYFDISARHGLHTVYASSTRMADASIVSLIRPTLAPPYRELSMTNLSTLGIWLVQVGPAHPLAMAAVASSPGAATWSAERLAVAPAERLSAY